MEGFVVFDYEKQYPHAQKELAQWLADGKIKRQETIIKGGIEKMPEALGSLFEGRNTGMSHAVEVLWCSSLTSSGKMMVEVKAPASGAQSKL